MYMCNDYKCAKLLSAYVPVPKGHTVLPECLCPECVSTFMNAWCVEWRTWNA